MKTLHTHNEEMDKKLSTITFTEVWAEDSYKEIKNFITNQNKQLYIKIAEGEIERLESQKYEWLTSEEMEEHENCRYKRNNVYVGQVAGNNFNRAIEEQIRNWNNILQELNK